MASYPWCRSKERNGGGTQHQAYPVSPLCGGCVLWLLWIIPQKPRLAYRLSEAELREGAPWNVTINTRCTASSWSRLHRRRPIKVCFGHVSTPDCLASCTPRFQNGAKLGGTGWCAISVIWLVKRERSNKQKRMWGKHTHSSSLFRILFWTRLLCSRIGCCLTKGQVTRQANAMCSHNTIVKRNTVVKIASKERICKGKQCKKNTKSIINNTPKPNYCFWSATLCSDKQYTYIRPVCLHFPRHAVIRSLATTDQQTRKANVP